MKKKAKILTTLLTVSALLSVTFLMRLFLHSRIVTQYPSVSATASQEFQNTYISSETGSDNSRTEGTEQKGYQETAEQFVKAYFSQSPDQQDSLSILEPFCSSKLWNSLIARYGVPSSSLTGQIPYRSEVVKLHIYYDNGGTGSIRAVAFLEIAVKVGDAPEKTQPRILSIQLIKDDLLQLWQVDGILYDQASEQPVSAFL